MAFDPHLFDAIDGVLTLPDICAMTGGKGPAIVRRKEKVIFFPYWSLVLIPFGLLPFLIAWAVLRREQKVSYCLSPRGIKSLRSRRRVIAAVMAIGLGSIYFGATKSEWFFVVTILFFLTAAVLYRRLYFPFQFTSLFGAIVVSGLPQEFDGTSLMRRDRTPSPR
jgi:hypothetical protein